MTLRASLIAAGQSFFSSAANVAPMPSFHCFGSFRYGPKRWFRKAANSLSKSFGEILNVASTAAAVVVSFVNWRSSATSLSKPHFCSMK